MPFTDVCNNCLERMKLISLNTWGGRAGKDTLLEFFKAHKDVDIFCLQEIWSAPYPHLEGKPAGGMEIDTKDIQVYGMQEISTLLDTHQPYFKPAHLDNYGLMMLVHKNIKVLEEGEVFVYKEKGYVPTGDVGDHARNVQYVTCDTSHGVRTIMNFHGLWQPGAGHIDNADRLKQSENIAAFVRTLTNPYVIAGDFNLMPETKSLKILEDMGMHNLVKKYGITSTRTHFYTKPDKFADYALVSPGIEVKDFKILPDEVSDHSPLYVEFE